MPTVFQVLRQVCRESEVPLPMVSQRIELGKKIAQRYHDLKFKTYLFRIEQEEGGSKFTVLAYPREFKSEMYQIIVDYIAAKSAQKIGSFKPSNRK